MNPRAAVIFAVTLLSVFTVSQNSAAPRPKVFRDCPACPEMVVIPAGNFNMGASDAGKAWAAGHGASLGSVADEAPQHKVSAASFAIGKYDVTRGEYAAFVRETKHPPGDGCNVSSMPKSLKRGNTNWKNPGFRQTDRDPAVCVTWEDARAYVEWLNKKTGGKGGDYRLPSEAEWEYAARAGTTSKFWWGDDDAEASAHAWYKDNARGHTHPVGSKPPNAFDLYDMAGNVWQRTEDCYAENYTGAANNGAPNGVTSADKSTHDSHGSCMRVDRGSSWLYPAASSLGYARAEPSRFSRRHYGIPCSQEISVAQGWCCMRQQDRYQQNASGDCR